MNATTRQQMRTETVHIDKINRGKYEVHTGRRSFVVVRDWGWNIRPIDGEPSPFERGANYGSYKAALSTIIEWHNEQFA